MTLQLGDIAPDFAADTTEGRITFYDWMDDPCVGRPQAADSC